MNFRDNCFNFIRIVAAIQVFLGHATFHLELDISPLCHDLLICLRGVPIFFVLSGFLIWNSIGREDNFSHFLKKRIVRLYPDLWGGVILNAAVMLILYWSSISLFPFLIFQFTQSTIFQFWTPDSLRGYGCGTPNGALWTTGVMLQSYIVLWFIYKILHHKKLYRWLGIMAIFVLINIVTPFFKSLVPIIIYKLFLQTFIPYIWLFLIGAVVCEYFDVSIVILKKHWFILLIISAAVSFTHLDLGIYETIKSIFLGLAIIGFGYAYPAIKINRDYSYGLYVYHMIVINVFIEFGLLRHWVYALTAFAISLLLAFASDWLINKVKNVTHQHSATAMWR